MSFHYRVILLKIWKVVLSQKIFFWKFLRILSNYICSKTDFLPLNHALFFKMVSTNVNSLFFKNGFHKWWWVSIQGWCVSITSSFHNWLVGVCVFHRYFSGDSLQNIKCYKPWQLNHNLHITHVWFMRIWYKN